MTNAIEHLGLCPVCRKGHLVATQHTRVFEPPNGQRAEVQLQSSVCDACGETTTKASQHRENLRALAERKAHYGNALMGEEILALRKRYGLTQQQASALFGKGKIAFSRYESETSYPDESATLLLTLAMESPEVIKRLADKAGVKLPLWPERCEDEQRVKVKLLKVISGMPPQTTRKQTMRPDFSLEPNMSNTRFSSGSASHKSTVVLPVASNDSFDSLEVVAS